MEVLDRTDAEIGPLALAAVPPTTGASEPFEILRAGDFNYNGRELSVTTDDLDKAVANFERWQSEGGGVPVDYDHSFVETGDTTAAGWFTKIFRKGASLFGQVEWTPRAAELIRDREFRFFSPEFTPNWKNETGTSEGFTILAGALTNRPFLRGMTPVSLNQRTEQAAARWIFDRLSRLDSRESEARDETLSEVSDEISTETTETETDAPETPVADESVEPVAAAQTPDDETVTMSRSEVEQLRQSASKAEALSARLESVEATLRDERFASVYSRMLREGRVDAKDETRERWSQRVAKFGLDETVALMEELPAETVPVSERGSGSAAAAPQPKTPKGVDPEFDQLDHEIQTYAREHDVEYDVAFAAIADRKAAE